MKKILISIVLFLGLLQPKLHGWSFGTLVHADPLVQATASFCVMYSIFIAVCMDKKLSKEKPDLALVILNDDLKKNMADSEKRILAEIENDYKNNQLKIKKILSEVQIDYAKKNILLEETFKQMNDKMKETYEH